MSKLIWIQDALDMPLCAPECGVVWVFRMHGRAANQLLGSVRPGRADLADAALAREEAGAPRLLRRLLLRALAARVLGRHADDITVMRNAGGSLALPGCDLHTSVSGSGAYVAIALARRPVGVDIESLESGTAAADELCRWTALEASLKSCGRGFGDDAREIDFPPGACEWLCTSTFVAAAVMPTPPNAITHGGMGNFKANSYRRHAAPAHLKHAL